MRGAGKTLPAHRTQELLLFLVGTLDVIVKSFLGPKSPGTVRAREVSDDSFGFVGELMGLKLVFGWECLLAFGALVDDASAHV